MEHYLPFVIWKKSISNYRPISLTSNISKIFAKIMKERQYLQLLDERQAKEQAGFRQNGESVKGVGPANYVWRD